VAQRLTLDRYSGPASCSFFHASSPGLWWKPGEHPPEQAQSRPAGTLLASATSDCTGTCVKTDSTITNAGGANPVSTSASHYSIDIDAGGGGTILINKVVITYTTNKVGPASA
jgi:hypothetical protein